MPVDKLARLFALFVGTLDLASGLVFVAAPGMVLRLTQTAPEAAGSGIFVRFVGAFVAAIGALYLWTAVRGASLLRPSFELGQILRVASGLFAAGAVGFGCLNKSWLAVSAADAALIAAQCWFLKHLPLPHAPSSLNT